MKKYLVIMLIVTVGLCVSGCHKKQKTEGELSEPASLETLGPQTQTPAAAPQETPGAPTSQAGASVTSESAVSGQTAPAAEVPALPPSGPFQPSGKDIQTALKNAGVYSGTVDGKIGPMTKKAIEEFQKTHNLKADGKVGLKTWEELSKYLTTTAPDAAVPATGKR
jgi:hypothetical protein